MSFLEVVPVRDKGLREEVRLQWKPILTKDLQRRYQGILEQIAGDLREEKSMESSCLSAGTMGLALFFSHYAAAYGDDSAADRAGYFLEQSIDKFSDETPSLGLMAGAAGLAWGYQHCLRLLGEEFIPSLTEDIDEWLFSSLRSASWSGSYDLVYGLVGLGVYLVWHSNEDFADRALAELLRHLELLAVRRPAGAYWFSPPETLAPRAAQDHPAGKYDLGLAHGLGGVVGLLALLARVGFQRARVAPLLTEAVRGLLATERPSGQEGAAFGPWWFPGQTPSDCRSGWCYGDPGLASVLHQAGKALGQEDWRRTALRIAAADLARDPRVSGVVDAGLCHGAIGLGHIYNRLYQASGTPVLLEGSLEWYRRALDFYQPGRGIGGFASWWPGVGEWRPQAELLNGSAGIGLAILAAMTDQVPTWDRPLLLDWSERVKTS